MTHFEPRPGLDEDVAQRVALPTIRELARSVRARAQGSAPDAKIWITAHDERVRPSHVHTDGQVVPDNLRYILPKVNTGNDVNDIRVGHDMARAPRDPDLQIGNRINCRCVSVTLRDVIGREIHAGDAVVQGPRVTARVSVLFPRIVESEHPSEPDRGGSWFRHAIDVAADEFRAAHHR